MSVGDEVVIDFFLGDSADAGQDPGNVTVAILVDGILNQSEVIANTAEDGFFSAFQSVLTPDTSGSLSIRVSNSSGNNWLDNINVAIIAIAIPEPSTVVLGALGLAGICLRRRRLN